MMNARRPKQGMAGSEQPSAGAAGVQLISVAFHQWPRCSGQGCFGRPPTDWLWATIAAVMRQLCSVPLLAARRNGLLMALP